MDDLELRLEGLEWNNGRGDWWAGRDTKVDSGGWANQLYGYSGNPGMKMIKFVSVSDEG